MQRATRVSQPKDEGRTVRATYTVKEVAKLIGISEPTAYKMAREGALPCIAFGRRMFIPKAALENYLATCGGKLRAAH